MPASPIRNDGAAHSQQPRTREARRARGAAGRVVDSGFPERDAAGSRRQPLGKAPTQAQSHRLRRQERVFHAGVREGAQLRPPAPPSLAPPPGLPPVQANTSSATSAQLCPAPPPRAASPFAEGGPRFFFIGDESDNLPTCDEIVDFICDYSDHEPPECDSYEEKTKAVTQFRAYMDATAASPPITAEQEQRIAIQMQIFQAQAVATSHLTPPAYVYKATPRCQQQVWPTCRRARTRKAAALADDEYIRARNDDLCVLLGNAEKHVRYCLFCLRHIAAVDSSAQSNCLANDVDMTLDVIVQVKMDVPDEVWKRNLAWLQISAIKFDAEEFDLTELAAAAGRAEAALGGLARRQLDDDDETWLSAQEVMRDVVWWSAQKADDSSLRPAAASRGRRGDVQNLPESVGR